MGRFRMLCSSHSARRGQDVTHGAARATPESRNDVCADAFCCPAGSPRRSTSRCQVLTARWSHSSCCPQHSACRCLMSAASSAWWVLQELYHSWFGVAEDCTGLRDARTALLEVPDQQPAAAVFHPQHVCISGQQQVVAGRSCVLILRCVFGLQVKKAFSERRKMLRNTLQPMYTPKQVRCWCRGAWCWHGCGNSAGFRGQSGHSS